jgi:hypothetical protein
MDVLFQGFTENRSGDVGVARHIHFAKGVKGRNMVAWKISDYAGFLKTFRNFVIQLRNEGLFSEELYHSRAGGSEVVFALFEWQDEESRDKFVAGKLNTMRKGVGVTEALHESNMV